MPGSKKNLASSLSRSERYQLIERNHPELTLKTQAELLGVNRTSLYYQPKGPTPEEIALKHRIDEIYTCYPFYGSRRIQVTLSREGYHISRPRVQRCMREMGIQGISPGPNLSKASPEHKVYPYLLRDVAIERPNQVWGIDITYIRLHTGWMYLVAIMDWFSRYILSWEFDQTLEMPFVFEAMDRALSQTKPEICNSDQGSHFTCPRFIEKLLTADVQISMGGKGRAIVSYPVDYISRTERSEICS